MARLAYIRALEENAPVSKELIYCTALLHDIGRARQYEDGTPHDEAGAAIAGQILNELGFSMEEIEAIVSAIRGHRARDGSDSSWKTALYCGQKIQKLFFL